MHTPCKAKTLKKYTGRPSPPYAAAQCKENLVMLGNDGNQYIVRKASNGVHRWVRHHHATADALKPKTGMQKVDYGKLTVVALKALLTRRKIAFPSKAKKADLVQLAETHANKWYGRLFTKQQLSKVIGFQAYSEKDVTLQKLLDNYSSRQEYQKAKRRKDDVAGYEIIGKTTKYYLQEYPL